MRAWLRWRPQWVAERWRAAGGALLGLGLAALFLYAVHDAAGHWMLVPLAGTVVILYVQPHSPVAQPWPIVGSYSVSAVLGFACAQLLAAPPVALPPLAAAVAIAASIWLMLRWQCVHPPGAAMALLIVLDGPHSAYGMVQLAGQLVLNIGAVMGAALLVSNAVLRRPYPFVAQAPANRHQTRDATPLQRTGLTHEDLASALAALDSFVDVQEQELVEIYNLAVDHAFGRHVGLRCGDIMSRDVMTAHFDTELLSAWRLLRQHHIQSLPVVDRFGHLLGIATVADFLRHVDTEVRVGLGASLQGLLRRTPGMASRKPEVVGQIMSTPVWSASPETPLSELVAQVAQHGRTHIPVLDAQRQVVGIVTQSDVLVALYKRLAMGQAATR